MGATIRDGNIIGQTVEIEGLLPLTDCSTLIYGQIGYLTRDVCENIITGYYKYYRGENK